MKWIIAILTVLCLSSCKMSEYAGTTSTYGEYRASQVNTTYYTPTGKIVGYSRLK